MRYLDRSIGHKARYHIIKIFNAVKAIFKHATNLEGSKDASNVDQELIGQSLSFVITPLSAYKLLLYIRYFCSSGLILYIG